MDDGENNDYALKFNIKIYSQKQSERVWYKYLTKNLLKALGFTKSDIDECVFYKGNSCISYIHMTQ